MAAVYYDSLSIYVQSATSLKDKLVKVNSIIDMLYTAGLTAAGTENIAEYSLDDGQTKIRTVYKGTGEVLKAIDILERQRQTILNQLNGRITRHVDGKNFNRFGNGQF